VAAVKNEQEGRLGHPPGSTNPLLARPSTAVSPTRLEVAGETVAEATSTGPNPPHAVSAYDINNGTSSTIVTMDMANPLAPGAQGVRTDLNISIPQDASGIYITGRVSGSPAFEVNVTNDSGNTTNVKVQNAPASATAFVAGLEKTNTVNVREQLKPAEREKEKK
jgi:hypothetical protein